MTYQKSLDSLHRICVDRSTIESSVSYKAKILQPVGIIGTYVCHIRPPTIVLGTEAKLWTNNDMKTKCTSVLEKR
jgi:hypothetical protein